MGRPQEEKALKTLKTQGEPVTHDALVHRFSERIQLDGRPVSDEELADLLKAVRRACPWQDDPPTGTG